MSSPFSASVQLTDAEDVPTIRAPSLHFSDNEDQDSEDSGFEYSEQSGDYSSRIEELLGDEDSEAEGSAFRDDDDDGGFLYTGVDADTSTSSGYRQQLRDVLGHDNEDDSDMDTREVEQSLLIGGDTTNQEDILVRDIKCNVYAVNLNRPLEWRRSVRYCTVEPRCAAGCLLANEYS